MSSANKADRKAAIDAASWMFNVVTSVGIILVNKALMATYGFSFGIFSLTIYQILICVSSPLAVLYCIASYVYNSVGYDPLNKNNLNCICH